MGEELVLVLENGREDCAVRRARAIARDLEAGIIDIT
jgi:hypothetical protein